MADETGASAIGVRAAAKAAGLNPSTVTRYLRKHPELNRGTAAEPKVVPAELIAHRANYVNAAMSNNHAGRLQDEPAPAADERRSPPGEGKRRVTYADARAVTEAAKATTAQLDLAERLGQTVALDRVDAALYEAGQALQQLLDARRLQLSDELAALADPAAIEEKLEAADRDVMTKVSDALDRALGLDSAAAGQAA